MFAKNESKRQGVMKRGRDKATSAIWSVTIGSSNGSPDRRLEWPGLDDSCDTDPPAAGDPHHCESTGFGSGWSVDWLMDSLDHTFFRLQYLWIGKSSYETLFCQVWSFTEPSKNLSLGILQDSDPPTKWILSPTVPIWWSKNVDFTPSANSSVARKGSERVVGKDGDLSVA